MRSTPYPALCSSHGVTAPKSIDFISESNVTATPEEKFAVQVLSKILVNDYGYPKAHIRTRPQWQVKARPSDTRKEYSVDIAVVSEDSHTDDSVRIIVE